MRSSFVNKILVAGAVVMAAFCESGAAEKQENAAVWSEDYAQVRKMAAEKKLPVIMLFSGSDWCPPCIRLDKTVFHQKKFADFAKSGKALFFHADFPRRKSQPENISKQNRHLMQVYRVEGVPTVILTDHSGREFARTGFLPGGVDKYIRHLEELLKKAPK